ncbi:MAG: sigma-54-dependent Fis family transcriptional regulator [Planctomycetes bacterium]|nr:sigma-54-dependent Fis family transcriptional regulator [Planctomycetota bacterium]
MSIFEPGEREFAEAASGIAYCNPFLPERLEWERKALGEDFQASDTIWHPRTDPLSAFPNVDTLSARATQIADAAATRLRGGARPSARDLRLYEDLALFTLYHEFEDRILETVELQLRGTKAGKITYFPQFVQRFGDLTDIEGLEILPEPPAHLFALFFHLRRAFFHIFSNLVGSSVAMARLRGAIWQSIFTHDMRRYRKVLFDRMGDITTLILGASGTGKELVARAIGYSRYLPFDPRTMQFSEDFTCSFYALNLSALSTTLIESELFGHRRGSFTGALDDHSGWFEVCGPLGSVFLDEIGELDTAIQVKLLRLLQTRTFQRIGDTGNLVFEGKVIAATNRNLEREMEGGQFREDFYYRLCADMIETPTLAEQIEGDPEELQRLVTFVASRLLGEQDGAELAADVVRWVDSHLGWQYRWPGNFRELEQCVRNIMVRGSYAPRRGNPRGFAARLVAQLDSGDLTAEDVIRRYCTLIYSKTHNYEETARRLKLDRRTVKAKIDPDLLEELSDRESV